MLDARTVSGVDYDAEQLAYAVLMVHGYLNRTEPWRLDALCREHPEVEFFPPKGVTTTREARAICGRCTVREECLASALAGPSSLNGVFGGTSPRERRALRGPIMGAGTRVPTLFARTSDGVAGIDRCSQPSL